MVIQDLKSMLIRDLRTLRRLEWSEFKQILGAQHKRSPANVLSLLSQ